MTKIAFMFPGQGSMEAGMGREVAEAVPEAMAVFDEASDAAGMDLKELCFDRPVDDLVDTEVQQPALVTTCLSLDAALRTRGIRPDAVVGHSVGEFAALGAADSLSIRDAVALVRERGIAMAEAAKAHPGSMAAILGLADEAVEALCHKIHNVWPANYNCPGQLVISGETVSVDEAIDEATREGARRAIKLRVSGAFHSPLVARAAERLRPAVERVQLSQGKAAFMSTVTAKVEDAQRYREGLVDQLTAPVRFTQAARAPGR
jgi:[acyl-carrier-protein] S-malonyltransferase